MRREMVIAVRMTVATLLLTGLAYPLAVTGLAQVLFPVKAAGSLVTVDGRVAGSALIGQRFADPAYVQGRLSAAGSGYDAASSGGSNLGPTAKALRERVVAEVARLKAANPRAPGPVPDELVTASASGLDPHVSPETARWQAPRIAAARGRTVAEVEAVIASHVEGRTLGVLGEPRVNLLLLNLDLDRRFGRPARAAAR